MNYSSIKKHLKPYSIVVRRRTTINHAFAASVAPSDKYTDAQVREAIVALDQDPDQPLKCVYCGASAETWDHVFATVKNSHFSGHGHRLGNLLPCCKQCNSAKGNKDWHRYIETLDLPDSVERIVRIKAYLSRFAIVDVVPDYLPEYHQLMQIKQKVMALLAEADNIAAMVRMHQREALPDK